MFDMYMPLNHKRVKKQNQPAWMSDEIMNSIRNRDNLLKKARKSNIPADWLPDAKLQIWLNSQNDNLFKTQWKIIKKILREFEKC